LGDMEDRMYRLHGVRESEGERVSTCLCDDTIWPYILLREFLRGPSRAEILGLDEDLVTSFEVQHWSSFGIHGSLVSHLGGSHLFSEELMKGVEVYGILPCSSRGQVPFRVDRDVWVITLVGEEWGYPSRSVWSIVVHKLCKRQEFGPVILLVVTIDPEVLF